MSLPRSTQVFTRWNTTQAGPARTGPVTIDRELPDPFAKKKQNRRLFWVYAVGTTLACAFVFNYEKTSSPIINSVFYVLRRSDEVKQKLGANISYSSPYPWIYGPLNTVRGEIDISFGVKGDKDSGTLRLKATRESKMFPFDIHRWTLTTTDGHVIDLAKDVAVELGV